MKNAADKMPHAEFVAETRAEAARVAADVLAGRADVLDACHALSALLAQPEIEAATTWVLATATPALQSIVTRFGSGASHAELSSREPGSMPP